MEFVPGDWVRDAAIRVAYDLVEADDAGRSGSLHQFRDVAVHVIIDMMVVTWGETLAVGVENTRVEGVRNSNGKGGAFGRGGRFGKLGRGKIWTGAVNDIIVVPEVLGELLAGASHRLPGRWAGVVPEGETRIHDERAIRDCAMHADNIRMIFDAGERALDVVVPGVAIVGRVCDSEILVPFAKVMEGVGEVKGRFVALVRPIVDCVCSGPWTETAI